MKVYIVNVHHKTYWHDPFSWLYAAVRFFTNSTWDHTALILHNSLTDMCVVEMTTKGIKKTDYISWFLDKEMVVLKPKFDIDYDYLTKIIDLTLELRLKYDYRGTGWYQLLYSIGKFFNRKLGTHIKWMGFTSAGKAAQKFYCSEYVSWLMNKVGGEMENWYKLSPQDIMDKHGDKFKIIYIGHAKELVL